MKSFHLWAYPEWDSGGGLWNYIGVFETANDAALHLKGLREEDSYSYSRAEIVQVDTDTGLLRYVGDWLDELNINNESLYLNPSDWVR